MFSKKKMIKVYHGVKGERITVEMKPNNKYGIKRPVKHRRRTLNPTEKIDIAWEMLKLWKKTPVDQRPSWQTFKNDFYRSKNAPDVIEE